jgi:Tfp pilus assembly protein PilW
MYVTISATLLGAVSVLFAVSTDARIKNQSVNEVNQQGIAAMEYIEQTVRGATSITSPALGASASSVTLVVPTGAQSPTIIDVASNALETKEGTAAYVPLTNSKVQVTALTFTNVSRSSTAEALQISLTISRTNPGNRTEYSYSKTFTSTVVPR